MRRKIAMLAVFGGLAAGFGCHHIAGKHDCGYNPADYQLSPPTQPYPTSPIVETPFKMKDPGEFAPMPVPKPKVSGSDTDPKDKANDDGN